MPDLTPITREETLLDGGDLTPITRKEMFIKKIYDKTQIIPEPITREEYFLKKAGEGSGGDVTIEQLNVTQNGTYSESGKAYSPVTVNVSTPENAYLLEDAEGLPSDIATFEASNLPMNKLKVGVEPIQDLHGYDHPWAGGAGKNRFDKSTVNVDKYIGADGNLAQSQYNQDVTDYIPVVSGQTYMISHARNTNNYSCFYDENKTMIGSVFVNNQFPIEAPTNAKYMRVTFGKADVDAFQVEIGTTSTSYAPYSNICPISGWSEANVNVSGVNVWDEEWELGLINSNNGSDYPSNNNIRSKYIPIKSGNYYFKTPQNSFIFGYDKNKNYIGRVAGSGAYKNALMTITDTNCAFIRFYVGSSYGTTYNNDISINYPSTDTDYHAYNGHTYTIDLDGTRYGGELDVVSGVLTVDRVGVDMGDLNWEYYTNDSKNLFYAIINTQKNGVYNNSICSAYKAYPRNTNSITNAANILSNGEFTGFFNTAYAYSYVFLRNDDYTDATIFKTAMAGQKIVYELATPLTIQLTPTQVKSLLGSNNVWADTGKVLEAEFFTKGE